MSHQNFHHFSYFSIGTWYYLLTIFLKPRRKYQGEDEHKIALEIQHKAFTYVHRHMKKAKQIQAKYADKNSKPVDFEVGDPVYLKNHTKKNKFDIRWRPYFRIIKKTSPVSFWVKSQLDGTVTKAHAEHLRLAKIDGMGNSKN